MFALYSTNWPCVRQPFMAVVLYYCNWEFYGKRTNDHPTATYCPAICALLGCYWAYSGYSLSTFRSEFFFLDLLTLEDSTGVHDGAVGWDTALQVGRSRVRFPMLSLEFFIVIILPAALWPCSWLILEQKWVPGIFLGGKGGRCVGLTTLPPSYADCLEIWEPQPPGTLRACPGL